ncbi:hypothetical protein [Streptomyces atroolivaceus]|uniref:hypothetical protein n=1 Tax=Streptomyces atroolivaceus TaxID=66869 RepID=UPI0020250205|nr:hypothetical protein [Streptomyces atroolivaceus]
MSMTCGATRLDATPDGLRVKLHSGSGQADFARAAGLAQQAAAITTIPGYHHGPGPGQGG